MRRSIAAIAALGGVAALGLVAIAASAPRDPVDPADATIGEAAEKPVLGLFSGLPIYWNPIGGFVAALNDDERHWARTTLEQSYHLQPLDVLGESDGAPAKGLAELDRLLVVQPRALTAADNVALDRWVRTGGRLVLAIDPVLTEHFEAPIGHPDRPNAVGLAPPVLARWGLGMTFDDDAQRVTATVGGQNIPVDQHGRLEAKPGADSAQCHIAEDRITASCQIGEGTALVMTDAAVFDAERPSASALRGFVTTGLEPAKHR